MANFTIGKKLFLGTGTLVLFTFALGVSAFLCIDNLSDRLHNIIDSTVRKQALASAIASDSSELSGITRGMIVRGMVKDDEKQQANIQQFSRLTQRLDESIERMQGMNVSPDTKENLKSMKAELDAIRPAKDSILEAFKSGDVSGALSVLDDTVLVAQGRMDEQIQSIGDTQAALLASDSKAAAAAAASCRWIAGILLVLTLLVAGAVVHAVRRINGLLSSSVLELAQSSEQIAAAAGQVSASSQSLAQGSSEQAATIEETSSVSIEINSMAQRNADNSKQTAAIVTGSEAGFQRANDSLSQMVVAMEGIGVSSQKISKIIKVIDEIAFQTNILALNAAVEAARAGDAGMGFAVVADEVRSLAQRCAQAAKDTTDLIEDSMQKSDSGMTKVDQVAIAIRQITAQSAQIKTLVDEINVGSIEQSRGIDQISNSIGQMEQVTQSGAANAEQTAAAAEQLSAQAKAMNDVVLRLRSMVESESQEPRPPTTERTFRGNAFASSTSQRAPARIATAGSPASPGVRTQFMASFVAKPAKVAAGAFPMDDDFKEF